MPEDFYKVGPPANRRLDVLGLRALERDWAAWPGLPSDDLMKRSEFNLLYDIGVHLFGKKSRQALDYATYFMAKHEGRAPIIQESHPQGCLTLKFRDSRKLAG